MRSKLKFVAALVGALLVGAGVAWAVLMAKQTTATTTITAQSVGNVNIGDTATKGLLPATSYSGSGVTSGWTATGCFDAVLTNPQGGDVPKFYFGGAGGALAPNVSVTLYVSNFKLPTTAGQVTCDSTPSHWTQEYTGTLADALASHGSYATGYKWSDSTLGSTGVEYKLVVSIPSGTDGTAIAGQSAAFAGILENDAS